MASVGIKKTGQIDGIFSCPDPDSKKGNSDWKLSTEVGGQPKK